LCSSSRFPRLGGNHSYEQLRHFLSDFVHVKASVVAAPAVDLIMMTRHKLNVSSAKQENWKWCWCPVATYMKTWCKERGKTKRSKCRIRGQKYVEDPEETPGRRVMIRIRIRSEQIPVRSGLIPFNLRFVISISSFYCLYGVIAGRFVICYSKIPIYFPFYCSITLLSS
jgi:hypothetical protein